MPKGQKPSPSWRERFAALRYVPAFIRMVWQIKKSYTVLMIVIRLARALIPIGALWAGKLIIDAVIAIQTSRESLPRLWRLVAIEAGLVILGDVLARSSALVESLLGDLLAHDISIRLMKHAATLDLYQFENPAFYDQLERARRQTSGQIGLLSQLFTMGQEGITLISFAAALFVYNPWLLLLLTAAILPGFFAETRFAWLEYSLFARWTPERRRLDYLRYVGASNTTAKEVQMFGLAPWLIDRYRILSRKFYDENKRLSIRRATVSSGMSMVGTLGYYAAYVLILLQAAGGIITVGSLTFLAGSFSRSRGIIQGLLMGLSNIYEKCLYLKDLFDFLGMEPSIRSLPNARPVPRPIREGFIFEHVSFKYPGSDTWALRDVSLQLRPGERVALVGENGAGKTTLTKLVARLYDPTEGRILLDGCDLREYDVASVRQNVGVIFQDFVRYDFRFDENVGVGEIEEVRSYLDEELSTNGNGHVPAVIKAATEKSLASSLLNRFEDGYRQVLGRRFEGGVELSGGEWQKVALARAYMRDAQALILDEPTAALDARAEYEVFIRFARLIEGRIAIIISHRFSTVRMADRIIVLQTGAIVESGTHAELVAQGGLYAELFRLQAEGYR